MSNVQKNYMISYSRIIATVLVVLGHVLFVFDKGYSWPVNNNFINIGFVEIIRKVIYSFHMSLFFIISGFVYSNADKKYSFKIFLKKKIIRLIIPFIFIKYFVWQPINLIINPSIYGDDLISFIFNYIFDTEYGHLWFILTLFIIEIIFYILYKYFYRNKYIEIFGFIFLLVLSIFSNTISNIFPVMSGLFNNVFLYLVYFQIGIFIFKYKIIFNSLSKDYIYLFICVLLFIILFIINYNLDLILIRNIIYFFLRIFGSLSILFFSDILSKMIKIFKFSKLEILTMPIYLYHQCLLFLIIYFWKDNNYILYSLISFILCFFIPIIISSILSILNLSILDGGIKKY